MLLRSGVVGLFGITIVQFLSVQQAVSQTPNFLRPPKTENFKCLSNGCCDQHEWCRFWASIGECRVNRDWMDSNCQLACNTCPVPLPTQNQPPQDDSRSTSAAPQTSAASSFPGGSIAAVGSCGAVAQNQSHAIELLSSSGLLNPIEDSGSRVMLSLDDITRSVSTGCVPQLSNADCSVGLCYHLAYRTMDGACNNLRNPMAGASFRPYQRLMPPEYDDGIGEPVSSIRSTRPSVREVSRILLSSAQIVQHESFNSMLMQWGQFISHDVARTTLQPSANCPTCEPVKGKCIPVKIIDSDPNASFKSKQCLKISRSAPVCGSGTSSPRQQLNENTAYVDGSQIYGSSSKDLHKFRDGRTGMLKISFFNNMRVLPFDETTCRSETDCKASFVAGDIRANLFIGLSSLHILFAREHNRIAQQLQQMNPNWSGDRLFQEARKIVGAEIQAILYNQYLPKILGSAVDRLIGTYKGYDPTVDATISNVFTTSAYRFGHGMIMENYPRIGESGQPIPHGPYTFSEGVFKSNKVLFEGGVDPIMRGLWSTAVKRPHRMTPAITESMFGTTDLGSVNIMRGREHGIPSYNKWRKFCGMPHAQSFDELKEQILDSSIRNALANNFASPDDVDLYVGAMVEDPVIGGLVGSTLACIIGEQFKRTRDGDRFYYENPGIFTPAQVVELKKASLSRILCDNGDAIREVPPDAFVMPKRGLVPCSQVAAIDLSKWKE
ncbi:ShKT domain-containing protein [Aphelenchoides besseyi]|nr:ShKT domain-containing protein [Aphelenchoides besseyi]KAI6211521.1 ShKT domain-containing protein [Aphelenchoides besseyi]